MVLTVINFHCPESGVLYHQLLRLASQSDTDLMCYWNKNWVSDKMEIKTNDTIPSIYENPKQSVILLRFVKHKQRTEYA